MVVLAVGGRDDTKQKTNANYLCNGRMKAFLRLVFA